MSSRLKENFLRHAILVVDHSKDALISLVDLDLSNNGFSFEQFINKNQHEIYHLHNSSRCCQCPNGYNPPRTSRIVHVQQMDLLFDRTSKLSCHKSGRSADYCCSTARRGLRTDILDLTLARCLLVNFCLDVFWYSCLNHQGKTLEDFLNNHKHDIYHLWQYNTPCCQCPVSGYSFPNSRPILDQTNWIQMYNALKLPCLNHKKRPIPGSMHSICSVAAMSGITVTHLDPYLSKVILQHICSLRQTVETLVQIRNVDYGHATAGEMTDQEYNKSVTTIELSIMEIGRVCNKETHFQGVIHDAKHGTLQYTLFEKYKDSMIETLARQDEFSKNVTEIVVPRLDRIEGKIAFKAKKIPTVIAEKIPKIIGESVEQFQETLGQNPTNQVFICQTAFEIQSHVKERTYVETNAVRKCIKNAEKYDVFVIYGSEGTGKTRTGLEILRQFGSIDQSYDLIKISILEEVKQVITDKGKIVILLDDVFRTNYCSCESVKSNNILDLLHSRRFAGNLKLIFTIDSAIRRSVKELFNSHRLFQGRYQMDLTLLQFCMTDPEKEEVLSKFCEYKKIQIKLNKPERCKDRILDRKTFYEITMTDPYIGYPKACFLFTSDIQNFLQGARFFKHTSKSLIDKVNTLSYKTDDLVLYATLVYILLCDSCITVDSIQVQKVADIMQLCGSRQRFIPKCNIIHSLEKMDGKYLVYDAYDKSYQFKHQMVYEAVVLSYFDVDPDSVIYVLTFEFISEMVRLQTDNFKQNEEIVLIIHENKYINLAKQLLRILQKDYQKKSFKFVKMLCETNLILQNDAEFVNILLKESETCVIYDETDLSCLDNTKKVKFYFCSALLLYLTRKQNVDNSITMILSFLERIIKDGRDQNLVIACTNTILSTFDYLCETFEIEEVDVKSALIIQTITKCEIDCNFNEFIHRAMDNEKDSTASFLLEYLSQKINLVEFIMNLEAVEMPRIVTIASETFKIPSSCTYRGSDRIELIKWLINKTHFNTFNINNIIITSATKNLVSLLTWCLLETNLCTVDVNGVMNYACEKGLEEVLIILMNKNMFHPNNVVYIFNTASTKSMEHLMILMLKKYDKNSELSRYPSFFDVQTVFTTSLAANNFITMKCLILNVKNHLDMRMIMKNICFHLDSCQIYPFYDWLLQEADKHIKKSVRNNANLEILKWSLTNFASHRKTLVERIYGTLNSLITNYADILHWFQENVEPSVLPVNYVMDMTVRKRFTKILIWILKNYDHELCDLLNQATEVCKSKDRNLIEIFFSNVDHRYINLAVIMQIMIATNRNIQCSAQILWILQNVDHTLLDMKTLMTTACEEVQIDIVQYLIENVDHTLFDLKTVMNVACQNESVNIVRYLIENVDHTLFDMTTVMNTACFYRWLDIVKLLIENVRHTLLDMKTVINIVCQNGSCNIVKYLIENVDYTLFDMKSAMTAACQYGSLNIMEYLIENVVHALFDMKTAMNEACEMEHIAIVKYMIENVDHTLFDMKTVMNAACQNGWLDIVKYLMENVDHTLFDMNTAMNEACEYGWLDIVKYLMENVDHTLFDMKTAMNEACQNVCLDIVKYLMENVDHPFFDMETAMNEACEMANIAIVKYMIENVDHTLFDMKTAINRACRYGRLDIVKYLMENVDHTLFDMKTAMNEACGYGSLDIVKYLMENVDPTLFDMETAMNEACEKKHIAIMKYMIENVDHTLFDMETAMNEACEMANIAIVKFMIENVDHTLFDMKTAMNEACWYGSLDIVKYLMENVDHTLFDMKTAMNGACQYGSLDIVKYLVENVDHTLFNMKTVMTEEIQELLNTLFNGIYDSECEDSGNSENIIMLFCKTKNEHIDWSNVLIQACSVQFYSVVKWLLNNMSHAVFDLDTAILRALHLDHGVSRAIVSLIFRNCDHTLMDMKTVINAICHHGFTEIAMEALKDQKLSSFDLKTIMNEACLHGDLNLVKWLWKSADNNLFDMKTAMLKVCRSRGKYSISVLKWLWENINRDIFNMEVSMDNACAYGRTETVKWLWINTNTETHQIQNALLKACESGHVSTVEWLIMNVPEHLLDLPDALQTVCSSSKCNSAKIIEVLVKHADKSKLNINSLIGKACKFCNTDIVRYLIDCTEIDTIDFKKALNSVLSIEINQGQNKKPVYQGKQDLVLLILQNADPSNINIEGAIIEACKHDWVDFMEQIWLNISHRYFEMNAAKIRIACEYGSVGIIQRSLDAISLECIDINSLMIESCGYGWINIVKRVWNHEEINHDKLDMKTAMNDACTYNRLEIVTWLLQNTDGLTFDMSNVLIESCKNGWIDIVKTVTQNGDSTFYNIMSCITQACTNSHLEVIEYMYKIYGTNHFDLKNIFECTSKASENEGVTMFLIRNFNIDSVYIPTIVTRAFSLGWTKVVKWIVEEFKYKGDLAKPLNSACENGEAEIVKYLLQNISNEKLDLKSAMSFACNKGWDDIVALLLQNVDHQKLNVRNAVIEACRCEDSDSVVLIIRQVDHKLMDLNAVLIEICKHSAREQLVLSILKTVDSSEFDRNIVMEKAKKHNWRKVLLFLDI